MRPVRRLFQEHAIFDEFTEFDFEAGQLRALDQCEFEAVRAKLALSAGSTREIQRFEGEGTTLFCGPVSANRTRFPRRIYFQITRHCNLNCSYCFIEGGPECGGFIPTESACRLARYLGECGLIEVRLTGGEPTTHPDLFVIADAFHDAGVYVSVSTNGVFGRQVLSGLAARPHLWVICSLDGGRDAHNALRPGTFDGIVDNLRRLNELSPRTRVRLTTVLLRQNRDQIEPLCRLGRSLGVESITFIPLRPRTRSQHMRAQMLSAAEFGQSVREISDCGRSYGLKVTTTIETDFADGIARDPIVRKRRACAAGREATNLEFESSTGELLVYGCSYSPAVDPGASPSVRGQFLAGRFSLDRMSDFHAIWRDDAHWTVFRDSTYRSAECEGCEHFELGHCVGSCPIQNVDFSKLPDDRLLQASLREALRRTAEWYCYRRIHAPKAEELDVQGEHE
jgi:MoaA/NifB/PqqE/SkfB family radical SAM enzyme